MIPTDNPESLLILADYLEEHDSALSSQEVRLYYSQVRHNSEMKDWLRDRQGTRRLPVTKRWIEITASGGTKSDTRIYYRRRLKTHNGTWTGTF